MTPKLPTLTKDRLRKLGIVASVTLAHLGAFAMMGRAGQPLDYPIPPPTISVELFSPVPPPPPPPPPKPAQVAGGGAPAAPSRVHVTLKPPPTPPELVAPRVPAPKPDPNLVGAAPISSGAPGLGQGGQGTGTGSGTGDGDGPGSGGSGPLILRGATQAEIFSVTPPAARSARRSGRGSVSCVIRVDQYLDDCRLVDETPPGFGFGEAALRAAPAFFRFRPPMTASGRPIEGQRVTVFVQFGRQGR
ncbi:energy transducer TonB [Brevundimonas sp.]|uniref:energy transducer TonB n=1 Tax=Brevundimonas sp. TaxID=1871086 RepID=UPI00356A491B